MTDVDLKVYAIKNKQGQWFSVINWRGLVWTDNFDHARKWFKIGPARGAITKIFKHQNLMPDLIEFTLGGHQVLDEAERRQKAAEKIKTKEEKRVQAQKAAERKRRSRV